MAEDDENSSYSDYWENSLLKSVTWNDSEIISEARFVQPTEILPFLKDPKTREVLVIEGKVENNEDIFLDWSQYLLSVDEGLLKTSTDLDSILCNLNPIELIRAVQCDLGVFPFPNRLHTGF